MIYLYGIFLSFFWFVFIYLTITTTVEFLCRKNKNYDINVKKIKEQRKFELKYSLFSIIVFALGSVILTFFYLQGKIDINFQNIDYKLIIIECLFFIVWNEIHFYFTHLLMHKTYLKRYHVLHHKIKNPSAFSSFALHPIEAMLLSTIMVIALIFSSFHIITLLFFSIWSLTINSIAHSNKNIKCKFLESHQLHHSNYHGNYGFAIPLLDKIFKTQIKK